MPSWPHDYQNWPSYLPYPVPLQRNKGWVPNQQSVDWPLAQWAPLYLPPGSPSFQAFRYPPPGPLSQFRPTYTLAGNRGAPNGRPFPATGPAGDIDRLPPPYYGGVSMPFAARFNPEEAPELVAAAVLDTPSDLPIEAVIATPEAEAAIPLDAEEQAEAAVTSSFVPFEPSLLEGLSDRMVTRLQKLETLLTKLDTGSLGPMASGLEDQLLKIHERIRGKLERRLERKAKRRGKRARKVRQTLRLLRARRAVKTARSPITRSKQAASLQAQKAEKIKQIRAHYQAGKITRERAEYLVNAILAGKRPSEARDIAIEAGGISKVGRAQRAHARGYRKGDVGGRVKSYFGR